MMPSPVINCPAIGGMLLESEIRYIAVKARARQWSWIVRDMHDWELPAQLPQSFMDFFIGEEVIDFRDHCKEFGVVQRNFDLKWEPI